MKLFKGTGWQLWNCHLIPLEILPVYVPNQLKLNVTLGNAVPWLYKTHPKYRESTLPVSERRKYLVIWKRHCNRCTVWIDGGCRKVNRKGKKRFVQSRNSSRAFTCWEGDLQGVYLVFLKQFIRCCWKLWQPCGASGSSSLISIIPLKTPLLTASIFKPTILQAKS